MTELRCIPVFNRGPERIEIGLEPEGDCMVLEAGQSLEIRYFAEEKGEPSIELEIDGHLLSIHCMTTKQVWRDGQRVR